MRLLAFEGIASPAAGRRRVKDEGLKFDEGAASTTGDVDLALFLPLLSFPLSFSSFAATSTKAG